MGKRRTERAELGGHWPGLGFVAAWFRKALTNVLIAWFCSFNRKQGNKERF